MSPVLQQCVCGAIGPTKPCARCKKADNHRRNSKPKRRQWHTHAFQRARALVLQRAGYICELQYEGCTGRANSVDHGNLPLTESHLWKAACLHCHGVLDGDGTHAA